MRVASRGDMGPKFETPGLDVLNEQQVDLTEKPVTCSTFPF